MGSATIDLEGKQLEVSVDPSKPVEAQVASGDGSIFVSVVSYRDGERCGATLKDLFENAKNPDKVFVGLVEQNNADDKFCVEEYCASFGATPLKRQRVRQDVTKIVTAPSERAKCPHFDQIRVLGLHHYAAKGPIYARSFERKLLANEEFCMQVDAHSAFAPGWDDLAISEWKKTANEFAIISHLPVSFDDKGDEDYESSTPRQCKVYFRDNGFPDYDNWDTTGVVSGLDAPLLSYSWSAAFSFAKCHLEESAPYDPFSWFSQPIEQVSRFARFWTRGYDVYTPTRAIAYHDYGPQKNGHGDNEWFKRQRDRFRKEALVRAKTLLQLRDGLTSASAKANLGIYGIGKRRTVEQLLRFLGVSTNPEAGNKGASCGQVAYVPYDPQVSPTANLYDEPDNLDPQPEYALRTNLTYYEQVDHLVVASPALALSVGDNPSVVELAVPDGEQNPESLGHVSKDSFETVGYGSVPSLPLILLLWCFGLVVWCTMFASTIDGKDLKRKLRKKTKEANFKEV